MTHPRCRNCDRLLDSLGRCACPEEQRRTSELAAICLLGALVVVLAIVAWGAVTWAR